MNIYRKYFGSPIGIIEITASEKGISTVEFVDKIEHEKNETNHHLEECAKQLDEYFTDNRNSFNLELDPTGTEFMKKVWIRLMSIPFGKTASYKDIAEEIGDINAVRAVGMANGRNNIAIIVPCHRVVGSNGDLTGYAYGVWRKEWLLKHEGIKVNNKEQIELFK